MFRRRSSLVEGDRATGLVFHWRMPVSSAGSMALAVLVVIGGALALAALVRIKERAGPPVRAERASVVLVPSGGGGSQLEREAREAGPFPYRWNPAADPAYSELRGRALRLAESSGLRYRPHLRRIELPVVVSDAQDGDSFRVLPPLPNHVDVRRGEAPEVVEVTARVVRSGSGPGLDIVPLTMDPATAGLAIGRRFLLRYDGAGRVLVVTPLDRDSTPEGMVGWLERAEVREGGTAGGWVVAEAEFR